jgi:hypothetical protein
MVGTAQAGERWPTGPCSDVQRAVAYLEKTQAESYAAVEKTQSALDLAISRQGI